MKKNSLIVMAVAAALGLVSVVPAQAGLGDIVGGIGKAAAGALADAAVSKIGDVLSAPASGNNHFGDMQLHAEATMNNSTVVASYVSMASGFASGSTITGLLKAKQVATVSNSTIIGSSLTMSSFTLLDADLKGLDLDLRSELSNSTIVASKVDMSSVSFEHTHAGNVQINATSAITNSTIVGANLVMASYHF